MIHPTCVSRWDDQSNIEVRDFEDMEIQDSLTSLCRTDTSRSTMQLSVRELERLLKIFPVGARDSLPKKVGANEYGVLLALTMGL